jgi:hypothetical protein
VLSLLPRQERGRIKALAARCCTTVVVGVLGLVYAGLVVEDGQQGVIFAIAFALLVLASALPGTPARTRAWLLVLIPSTACLLAIPQFGFAPDSGQSGVQRTGRAMGDHGTYRSWQVL